MKACDAFDVMEALPTIKVPPLGIVGEKNIMTPKLYPGLLIAIF